MKRILITGADSYIGTSFEKYAALSHPGEYEITTLDLRNSAWEEADFSGFDTVLHVAGIAHAKETRKNAALYYSVNRDLAVSTAKKAKACGVRQFIFLSSMSVYGINVGHVSPDTLPRPKSHYGRSKLEAEKLISEMRDENFRVALMRPPMVYGRGCRGNYCSLSSIAKRLPLFPRVKNRRSMIYIDNLCELIRLLSESGEGGLFFPQNAEYVNTTEMAELICRSCGKKLRTTSLLNWAVAAGKPFAPALKKAFGSLTYDKSMSRYRENYNIVGFDESISSAEAR